VNKIYDHEEIIRHIWPVCMFRGFFEEFEDVIRTQLFAVTTRVPYICLRNRLLVSSKCKSSGFV